VADLDPQAYKKKIEISRKHFFLFSTGAILTTSLQSQEDDLPMKNSLRLDSLEKVQALLVQFAENPQWKATGDWDTNRVFHHCAQSIEYSMTGYPENKSFLFQKTIGKIVLGTFLYRGYMSHNLSDPIPGAPPLPNPSLSYLTGLERLQRAVISFLEYTSPPAPHFVYGEVSHTDYNKIHAMHIANHLNLFEGFE
jgi:hypothetical protein